MKNKKIVLIDMDGVIADFRKSFKRVSFKKGWKIESENNEMYIKIENDLDFTSRFLTFYYVFKQHCNDINIFTVKSNHTHWQNKLYMLNLDKSDNIKEKNMIFTNFGEYEEYVRKALADGRMDDVIRALHADFGFDLDFARESWMLTLMTGYKYPELVVQQLAAVMGMYSEVYLEAMENHFSELEMYIEMYRDKEKIEELILEYNKLKTLLKK